MEITTLINAHGHPEVVADTVDSVRCHLTPNVYVIADGGNANAFAGVNYPCLIGLPHMHHRAPYRNMILGLSRVIQSHPRSDWYIYMDYDCLILSDAVVSDLAAWQGQGVWAAGADHRIDQGCDLSYAEAALRTTIGVKQYLLGAFMAFHRDFISRLCEMDFWERMLFKTSEFQRGFFPGYGDWDISEHLYPSLAASLGGKVIGVSRYDQALRLWEGGFQRYPIRWQPEIAPQEILPPASVAHPVKSLTNPIRVFARARRRHEGNAPRAA